MTLPYNVDQMSLRSPRSMPDVLYREPASTKLVWLFLRPQGEVTHSRRDVAELLGVQLSSVQVAFSRMDDLGLIEYHGVVRDRTKRRYSVLATPKQGAPRERV